jgi:GNAT superfamily N-acetyltransferase
MLVLFDQGTPRGIARWLLNHTVKEAKSQGWDKLTNGELLTAAEDAGFDVLLTRIRIFAISRTLRLAG